MQRTALVAGVSGIGGSNTARELVSQGWTVYGLARRPATDCEGLSPV
jgi:GDP-D-mannose dehydratase